MSLRELYQEIIIDHGRQPRNFGCLAHTTHKQIGNNPLCGDNIVIYVFIENDVIKDITFEGTGCAISMASASLMTESLKDKTTSEAKRLFSEFHSLVTSQHVADDLGKLAVFSGVAEFPVRVKCATLAWHTLRAALDHDNDPVSTE